MKKTWFGLAFAVVGLVGAVSYAVSTAQQATLLQMQLVSAMSRREFLDLGEKIAATTLDAASTTFEVEVSRGVSFGLATVWVSVLDAGDGVTDISMTCTGSKDNNTTDYDLQSCATSAGTCTSTDSTWSKDPSGNTAVDTKRWPWRVDIEGINDFECIFTDTGGDISDTIQVEVSLSTKG